MIRPIVNEYLVARSKATKRYVTPPIELESRPRPSRRLSPSGLVGCERAAVFRYIGVESRQLIDPGTELIFDDGNWRHHRWQATFADMERVLGPDKFKLHSIEEGVSYPSLHIRGSLDALVEIERKLWVVDIKGINDAGFQRLFNDNAPVIGHVYQLVTYLHARKVDDGVLLYENKNNQNTLEFRVRYDDDAWADVERWCTSVLSALKRQALPDMDERCSPGSRMYNNCGYRWNCYGDESDDAIRSRIYRDFRGLGEQGDDHAADCCSV